MHQCREVFVPQKMMFRSPWLVSRNKQDHLHKEIFVLRQHGHPEREREADSGSDLESDRPLPARRQQLPAQEAHARLAQGEHILIVLFYVNMAMMVTMLGDGGDGGVGEQTWVEPGIFHHAQSSSAGHDKGHPPPHPLCLHLRDEMQQTELAVKRTYIFNQASTPRGLSWWRR